MADFRRHLTDLVPHEGVYYQHDDFEVRTQNMNPDERENGHAHVKAMLLSATSHAIPVVAGRARVRHVAAADLLRDGRAQGPHDHVPRVRRLSGARSQEPGRLADVGIERRKSRQIDLGGVAIGGDAPVSIQSMTTTKTADINATLQQIASLVAAGVDIVRVAVPHWEDAEALVAIAAKSTVPVVADIHFQWKYAMAALEAGIQGLRINPGNIKYQDKVRLIAREAKDAGRADPHRGERRIPRAGPAREVREADPRGARRERAERGAHPRGRGLPRHQDHR